MELRACVDALKPQLLSTLRQNIQIPSAQGEAEDGAPYGASVRESLVHVLDTARELGFRTENMDGHLGWCEYGEGDEMVAVLGHLDVVPAGDGWSCDPFGGELRDGKIWGRGTTDDKGPAIASLFALAALRDSGLPIRRRIRILFGCNEEAGSDDIKYYLANGGEIPVMGFTPDGEYPVINGEKGIINVTFSHANVQTATSVSCPFTAELPPTSFRHTPVPSWPVPGSWRSVLRISAPRRCGSLPRIMVFLWRPKAKVPTAVPRSWGKTPLAVCCWRWTPCH